MNTQELDKEVILQEFKQANKQLSEVIKNKVHLANRYYQHKYPLFCQEDNYILYKEQGEWIVVLVWTPRVSINTMRMWQDIPTYDNNVEKEFYFSANGVKILDSGESKRGMMLFAGHEALFICSKSEYPALAKKHKLSKRPTPGSLKELWSIKNEEKTINQ